jgi:Cu/Zn superoxide dismutase
LFFVGYIDFHEDGHKVKINGKIHFADGVLDGKHAFHVHDGDAEGGCDAAGGHFNPYTVSTSFKKPIIY